ncbi:hypothetical protein K227x_03930 [Rubripirellula lacrimiformis]|uniref:FAD-dependent urate hydroxylase HpyO/Asp monooxygenase CreE-like FAD/NAD(P)-binding domain-containing protein n=1 Tax=Rubripirellula lacrimiformis TaxID=1930273 RepID=A0A517N4G3_9BACT|nr:FAD/NAD(P)-binding domain-containing protein [Rubripirellula lacrimiformis]QDT02022.1 hypothetical protein K227x_03930 [Rubripirellula lacrimiformis]
MKVLEKSPIANVPVAPESDHAVLRVAIIGCGPRGLQCLESISRRLTSGQLQRLCVTVFEPSGVPGAGNVYDPSQPRILRMNFATQYIDFWKSSRDSQTSRSRSLIGWLSTHHPQFASSDSFVPRAIVGEYLRTCFAEVANRFEGAHHFEVQRSCVSEIRHDGTQFVVDTDVDSYCFDEVVVTTGHEGLRGSAAARATTIDIPALPAASNLSVPRIPSGSRVLVRGFGLTAIDAVLSLTEGRGGEFIDDGFLPSYIHGSDEPACIDLRSRSGRPMLSKPSAKMEPISDSFWTPFRDRLSSQASQHGKLNFQRQIWPVIVDAAASLLDQSGTPSTARDVCGWYRGWSCYKMDAKTARHAMLQSYSVAMGKRPIDTPFALGDAWRRLYPEMVQLISHGGLERSSRRSFACVAREMERIAFGPPAENIGRLLTLMRERVVTIGNQTTDVSRYDAIINAVIAGPHEFSKNGPLQKLVEAGLVQVDPTCGGVMVDSSGFAAGGAPGLAVFGRATEGWVVGNDTLTRTLHDHIENWADCMVASIKRLG